MYQLRMWRALNTSCMNLLFDWIVIERKKENKMIEVIKYNIDAAQCFISLSNEIA